MKRLRYHIAPSFGHGLESEICAEVRQRPCSCSVYKAHIGNLAVRGSCHVAVPSSVWPARIAAVPTMQQSFSCKPFVSCFFFINPDFVSLNNEKTAES
jgi:hypothetical protein